MVVVVGFIEATRGCCFRNVPCLLCLVVPLVLQRNGGGYHRNHRPHGLMPSRNELQSCDQRRTSMPHQERNPDTF